MIHVTKPYLPDQKKYLQYVSKIYHSNHLTNNGPLVQELEDRLKEYLGVANLMLVSNGTIALNVAYMALGISGEAITTPFSFVATTSSLSLSSIKPVFADIDKHTFNLSADQIECHINPNTQAIVPVHVFGNACDVESIDVIAKKHGLKVVYDAAHAFGVTYKDQSVLNFGDVSTLSFHATKLFHTIEGGAIITASQSLDEHMRSLINFGLKNDGMIHYLGTNAKMNEFEAAMGLCILDDMDIISAKRQELYEGYQSALKDDFTLQALNADSKHNFSYFPIICENEKQLLSIVKALNDQGVYPRRYFYPSLDKLPYVDLSETNLENAHFIADRVLCLPLYPGLELADQQRIIEIVKGVK